MPFHEIYSRYYNAVADILKHAAEGSLTPAILTGIVQEKAFAESLLTIPENLRNETWPLITGDLRTPLQHAPTVPLTDLQKRWLKSLLDDPRIRLFDPPTDGLENVEPLYPPGTFVYFDRYTNGDPFEDPGYIERFRTILTAVKEKRRIGLQFTSHRGHLHNWNCVPYKLEYSSKDDKFRLITLSTPNRTSINLHRITECELGEHFDAEKYGRFEPERRKLVLEVTDERNALERVMLHFSHLEKQTVRIDDKRYLLTMLYEPEDETELLIRVLSFGPLLKALEPESFISQLKERIKKQVRLRTQQ